MINNKLRLSVGVVVVVAAIVYFALAGFEEGKAYYKTIEELAQMGDAAQGKRIRIGGVVADGSIERRGRELAFTLQQGELALPVLYVGTQPVPDTFRDGAEAVVEGTRLADGSFEADHIQAKCASKYEAGHEAGDGETGEASY